MSLEPKFFELLSIRGRIKLEALGMKHSSGVSIRKLTHKRLGLKPRDSYDKYMEKIQELIDSYIDLHNKEEARNKEN